MSVKNSQKYILTPLKPVSTHKTCKKIIFVREPKFSLKMSGQFIWKNFLNWVVLESILGCFMHEYSEMIIILIWFSQYQNKILTKCLKIFDFWKMSGFSSKNIRELGSQVPDFLHVCLESLFEIITLAAEIYKTDTDHCQTQLVFLIWYFNDIKIIRCKLSKKKCLHLLAVLINLLIRITS